MKKVIVFIVIAALVLTVTPALIFSGNNGPAEKATGAVWLGYPVGGNRYVEFNAHEPKGDEEYGKGSVTWYQWTGTQEWYEVIPTFQLAVKYVNVDGDTACFAAGPNPHPTKVWLVMKVKDGGSPATIGDEVSAVWVSTEDAAEIAVKSMILPTSGLYTYTLIGGNLVVHSYE